MLTVDIREKRYNARNPGGAHLALRDLRFQVEPGQFTCLIGPSGCGKSTLINIINGLDKAVDGRVTLDGVVPSDGVSTMFQTPRLMPWLSVLDNVLLVLEDTAANRQRAIELLGAMGLGDVLAAYPNRLSGGMQRRVALARAFAIRPRLLLLDEPFVSLDAPVANRLRSMLIELWQRHASTVLFVTHDLREALALGDRVLFLSPGPAHVVLDYPITLARPRLPDDAAVAALQEGLLSSHPALLGGLSAEPDEPSDRFDRGAPGQVA